jgi:hypothetical protein
MGFVQKAFEVTTVIRVAASVIITFGSYYWFYGKPKTG